MPGVQLPFTLILFHLTFDLPVSIRTDSDEPLAVFPGRAHRPSRGRRCRHDIKVYRMRTHSVETQRREEVRGVRQEGRVHEVLLHETLLHQ